MKNKIILVLILSVIGSFISCESNEDFLAEDPKGQLFADNLCKNEVEIMLLINGLHGIWDRAMMRPYQSMEIKFASSDDVIGTGNQRVYYHEMEVNMDITTGGDTDTQRGYERAYNTINQANTIINNYHNARNTVPEARLNALAAQAHFIRAFTYFWLVRFFNNIPLIKTAYNPDPDREVTVSPSRDIYDLIISDLEFAEQWLPIIWDGYMKNGAPTKGAAKSTMALVYLQMAGFPVNGGAEYYAKARDKAKEVIDHAGEYGYALREHYWQVWDPYWEAYEIPQDEAILWIDHTADDITVRAPNPSRPIEFGGWESMIAELGFFNRFPEGERKEFTFVTDFYHSNGNYYHYTDLKAAHPAYRKLWADNFTPGWEWENRNDPDSKWLTGMDQSASWYSGRPIIMMRYADVLLIYAEAKARTDGPDALAYQCLNDVRNRAYKGVGTTEASVSGLSTEEFIELVVWERAWEFAGFEYSARWFDLQRLELVEKATTEWREEPEEKYNLRKPYTKKDYFLPIPSKEVILNPNLENNNPEFQ
ncbi:RagB/SusD family nutrient uptake outer membrane protein [Mariniphaga sediminis]|uniref:RagB/SusD family nutrient uptake outer membrane protein n=1 Tax=Mariniphaga sediminis TaxID=1628158 RepID=A0A399CVD3_9BACT|nr:RagB/SusD family nutrient uptake outer membrane protein [Mariniphaga sediminis]RIH63745.1 RagB/SusD family nutrient uptake outer membrane protein [Mariniphaga sediminis]